MGNTSPLGAVANYRHLFSNERCSFESNPPPPPLVQMNTYNKCLWKNADQEMKVLPTWCDTYGSVWISEAIQVKPAVSLASQKGFFLSFRASSGIGIESTFRHSFCMSLTASARVDLAERVDKLTIKTLISSPYVYRQWSMKASPWA